VLALLSKTAVAPFPVVLLGLAWWRRGRVTGRDVRRSAPFFTASLVLGLMTVWFERHQTAQQIVRDDSFWSRLAGAGWAVWFYLYKAVAPLNLMFVYPRWQIDPSKALAYLPGVVVVGALLLLWRYRRRWGRAWLFCAGYYLVMLLPVLGFVNIGFMRYSLVADHWQYFAILGPIALIAAALTAAWVRWGRANQALGVGLGGALLLLLGVLTWKQARIYADEETLWRDTLAKNPACWLAHNNLGSALDIKGQFDAALPQFREALRLNPDYALAHYNLGTALVRQGGVAEAISHFQKALQINPGDPKTQNNLAWVLATGADASLRNGNEAVTLARQANEFAGGKDPLFLGTLAAALAEAGRFSDAARTARKGIELARAAGQPGLAARLSGELKRYEGRLPLHQ
jgi:tetratricopeptide (TPR) repeat protein